MPKNKTKKPVKYYTPQRRAWYAAGDTIDSLLLFNLYAWTCYLCKNNIDPRRRCPDWRAATIDHWVPFALGGSHTWDNVVPACNKCNSDKSDSGLDSLSQQVVHLVHLDRIVT